MPLTVEEEVDQIDTITDLRLIRDKRASRKGKLTLLAEQTKVLLHNPTRKLKMNELQKKLEEANRHSTLFDALQSRYEVIAKESVPKFDLASEAEAGNQTRAENDLIITELSNAIEKVELYKQGSTILRKIHNLLETENLAPSFIASELKSREASACSFQTEADAYEEDTDLHALSQKLTTAVRKTMERIKDSESTSSESHSATAAPISYHKDRFKLQPPTFDGRPLEWRRFVKLFKSIIAKDPSLDEAEKACLLMNSMTLSEAKELVKNASSGDKPFETAMEALRVKYGKERVIYREHLMALMVDREFGYNKRDLNFILDHWKTHLRGLEECDGLDYSNIFATLLEAKFKEDLRHQWNVGGMNSEKPSTIKELLAFIETRSNSDLIDDEPRDSVPVSSLASQPRKPKPPVSRSDSRRETPHKPPPAASHKCLLCKQEGHFLARCDTFKAWDQNKKHQYARDQRLCLNCLSNKHLIKDCKSLYSCRSCGARHHTLLHRETPAVSATQETPVMLINGKEKSCYLTTAIAMITHGDYRQKARVMLDNGSCASVITEDLASRLKVKRSPCPRILNFGPFPLKSKSVAQVKLSSVHEQGGPVNTIEAHIVPWIPDAPPPSNAKEILQLPCVRGKTPLADPHLGGKVDVLLSIREGGDCVIGGTSQFTNPTTTLTKTIFGWALGGEGSNSSRPKPVFTIQPSDHTLDEDLQRLWQMEQVLPQQSYSEEDQAAIDHFQKTHKVLADGRYAVQLPRKTQAPALGESKPAAIRRFIQNEKTLTRRGKLQEFRAVLAEYLTLGHAEQVPSSEVQRPPAKSYYLPVHGVSKESSTTTKLRAVFDASARTRSGTSLNDQLLTGPNLYPLLTTILIRFRVHKIALTADISKMFREVELQDMERDFHRFLIREGGRLVDCRMRRLTFGVKSSPFLATQVLRQLADSKKDRYPQASRVIKEAFYVDDCLVGASSVEEADSLRKELCELLLSAKMVLRKWRSNSSAFLDTVPKELQEKADLEIHDPLTSGKALGIHWNVSKDQFHVSVPKIPDRQQVTKRTIASITARVFDVLGFFSPATLQPKILLQKLWSLHIGWDSPVPEDILNQWNTWTSQLHHIAEFPIDRPFIQHEVKVMARQLHGFSDASTQAYGGVIYLRTIFEDTSVAVALVTSKARVAPLKSVTIPRLELSAAVLLTRLMDSVAISLNIPGENLFAWTDSTITLCWIRKPPNALKTFEANRVSQIQDIISPAQWHHVPTADNPADLASRGMSPEVLVKSSLWWHGPPWLTRPPTDWPSLPISQMSGKIPDLKSLPLMMVATQQQERSLCYRFSSFSRLVRVLCWCKRFALNCVDKQHRQMSSVLVSEEVEHMKKNLFRQSQEEPFKEALQLLRKGKPIPKSNSLFKLNVCLSDDGILMVRSRVRDDLVSSQPRLYTVLSLHSHITKLFVRTLHQELNHPGTSTMLATLAEDYYIPGVKKFLKSLSRNCVVCQKAYLKPSHQQMGMLPVDRTRPSPPFDRVGIDFAGPYIIRRGNPRKPTRVKVYTCLFVCMATRAVHLELCSDLSTEAFIAAFQRFSGRRGTPSHVFTDHGTNFVGARNDLEEIQSMMKSKSTQESISRLATSRSLHWHFIPSRAPHFGGLWEAGVKAMKTILRKNLAPHLLTYEELNTILIQAEAILNSRPLLALDATEADGPTSLTAGHFLVGRPLIAPPSSSNTDTKISLLKRWNLVERINTELWIQWRTRYLQSLQARSKWQRPTRNFKVGDVVIVKDDTLIHRTWPLGRILKLYPGSDGFVRSADILCNGREYNRAVNRLVLLVEDQSSTSST